MLRGAAASSRLRFTHSKVAVYCFHTQTMTCTFSLASLEGPAPASVSSDQIGRFSVNAELREIFVRPVTVFFQRCVLPNPILSSQNVTASSLAVNDTLYPLQVGAGCLYHL